MMSRFLILSLLLATCAIAFASDPSPLQDFCVADPKNPVLVNGVVCKDPKLVKADDFLFRGLNMMGNTSNDVGSNVTPVTVAELPGLNTFGISMARRILVGFVTSNPENRLITKILEKGDVFVFPQGLIHFQKNLENKYAVAIAGLSSQNPGVITIANAVFGSNPDIPGDILAKAFQVDVKFVYQIQSNRGFVTSNPENRLITKILEKGDVFVFPQGLIHFQKNLENKYAVAIAGLSSQNPGVITIANAVFGSNPDIPGDIDLAKAFQVDMKLVYQIQSKF
ncbi:hypothetical protein E3N88_08771 [Mikania micrantha]|uniref:Germin-like protein n=1 Tax=Mikania micrantha TaxID=192012 RepID=A0A5N6PKA0_9ASTR|nr:hypothetical protein E3N88_08771 [Mikania micrantha]